MVLPARINFSMCAVGAKLLLFGGEAERSVALADTHMVDLSQPLPFWQKLTLPPDAAQPAGRWGHSLRAVAVRLSIRSQLGGTRCTSSQRESRGCWVQKRLMCLQLTLD
jgi:hypothetical protein